MSNHIDIFTSIYLNSRWGDNKDPEYKGSSGAGSEPNRNRKYIEFVRNFIETNRVQSVCDLGCGDWRISVDLYKNLNVKYTGYDAYKELIEVNQKRYPDYNFIHLDILNQKELIQTADLCILRDILCHWKNEDICKFLSYCIESNKFKYILICNGNYQKSDNQDIKQTGDWRPLSARFLPLKSYHPKILFEYDVKEISCIYN